MVYLPPLDMGIVDIQPPVAAPSREYQPRWRDSLKIFAICSQLFVTGRQKLNDNHKVNSDRNQLKSAGNKQCK